MKGASRKALEGYKEILCATLSDNRITPEETWQMASWEILELNGGFYGKNETTPYMVDYSKGTFVSGYIITLMIVSDSLAHLFNGNLRILKWRYCTI